MKCKYLKSSNGYHIFEFYLWPKGFDRPFREHHRFPFKDMAKEHFKLWVKEKFETEVLKKYRLSNAIEKYLLWAKDNKSPIKYNSEIKYLNCFNNFIGNRLLTDIKRKNIKEFINWKQTRPDKKIDKLSASSMNKRITTISYFFNWCIDYEFLNINPAVRMKLKENNQRIKTLSKKQILELLKTCEKEHQKTFVLLGLCTGMRHSEILNLHWLSINYDLHVIELKACETKNSKPRVIPMPSVLENYLQGLELHNEYVVSYAGKKLKTFKNSWSNIKEKLSWADSNDLRIHDLRHVYSSQLRYFGTNLSVIQQFLGHSSLSMVQRYAHYQRNEEIENLEGFTELLRVAV